MTARMIGRALGGVAALLLLLSIALSLLPNHGMTVIAEPNQRVNCGTIFAETKWSGDDGCEGPMIGRSGVVFVLWLFALPVGAAGLLLIWRSVRYE